MNSLARVVVVGAVAALVLAGCAPTKPLVSTDVQAPVQVWHAPLLPHQGEVTQLKDWWSRWQDPRLVAWIEKAQLISASMAQARSTVVQAQAAAAAQDVLLAPQAGVVSSASRSRSATSVNPSTVLSTGFQASWALDIWQANDSAARQAQAQLRAANAGWHTARVLVAGEVARAFFSWHACDLARGLLESEAGSLGEASAALAAAQSAGLVSDTELAQLQVALYDIRSRSREQGQRCDSQVKALVVLTGVPEPEVREQLRVGYTAAFDGNSKSTLGQLLSVPSVPAEALRQRPDVWQSQWSLVAAAEGVGVARAQLLPSLTLSASWLRNKVRNSDDFTTWSLGPLAVTIPVVGRAALNARAEAAVAGYEAAAAGYSAVLRRAVAEVETELVALAAQTDRYRQVTLMVDASSRRLRSLEDLQKAGLTSRVTLEDVRRQWLVTRQAQLQLQHERINTWINLYLAMGGGFEQEDPMSKSGSQTS